MEYDDLVSRIESLSEEVTSSFTLSSNERVQIIIQPHRSSSKSALELPNFAFFWLFLYFWDLLEDQGRRPSSTRAQIRSINPSENGEGATSNLVATGLVVSKARTSKFQATVVVAAAAQVERGHLKKSPGRNFSLQNLAHLIFHCQCKVCRLLQQSLPWIYIDFTYIEDDGKVAFPSSSTRRKEPLGTIQLNTAPPGREFLTRPRTRTISNPRSRTPSLRTPATRRIQHISHQRPITPITTTLRPYLLQRSSSQGGSSFQMSSSWGSMSMPKSAKKWARTAHLHEVKTVAPTPSGGGRRRRKLGENTSPMRHDRENDRTPREFDFERERDDVFSSSIFKPSTNTTQKVVNTGAGLSPLEHSLLLKPEVNMDDGDPWVDTDSVDGSEVDPDQISTYQFQDP